jgi:NAD(P)-dependent dehydrogenase (short-subunit alcohol dehydrogenase family)
MHTQWDMTGRTVVITGGNSGIGLEAAVELGRMGADVVITARDMNRGAAAVAEITRRTGSGTVGLVHLDLCDLASVRQAADDVLARCDRIDVLINNAGGILSERSVTVDGLEATFAGNHLGHHVLTNLLVDRLEASAPARVVVVASLAHRWAVRGMSWDDLDRTGNYRSADVYAESKLANVLFTMELAQRLVGTGVTANACHPGPVRTGFGSADDTTGLERIGMLVSRPFLVTASRGAEPLVYLAASPEVTGVTGAYFSGGYLPGVHQRSPSRAARDPQAARRLWELSDQLGGLADQ